MRVGHGPGKNAWNIQERGLSFEDIALLDRTTAMVRQDRRQDYGEDRFQALVEGVDGRPHAVVRALRGETLWVISFRRARERERRRYGEGA